MVNLRDDTVTKPTSEMLEAMYNAKIVDYPAIIELEESPAKKQVCNKRHHG